MGYGVHRVAYNLKKQARLLQRGVCRCSQRGPLTRTSSSKPRKRQTKGQAPSSGAPSLGRRCLEEEQLMGERTGSSVMHGRQSFLSTPDLRPPTSELPPSRPAEGRARRSRRRPLHLRPQLPRRARRLLDCLGCGQLVPVQPRGPRHNLKMRSRAAPQSRWLPRPAHGTGDSNAFCALRPNLPNCAQMQVNRVA